MFGEGESGKECGDLNVASAVGEGGCGECGVEGGVGGDETGLGDEGETKE